jgi:hypothetical protein
VQSLRTGKFGRPLRPADAIFNPVLTLLAMTRISAAPFVAMLLIVMCFVVLAMVGSLCLRHWWYTLKGFTFIGAMKGEFIATGGVLCLGLA